MKFTIDQKVLSNALNCGGAAALSDVAQADTSNISNLVKSVKITLDDNFTIESATNLIATKFSIPAKAENGIEVKESGVIFIPAKELMSWVDKQVTSRIGMALSKLEAPEFIKTSDDKDEQAQYAIKKIGTVKLQSKDGSGTGSKWALDCYDSEQIKFVDFSKNCEKLFNIQSENIVAGIKNTLFSAQKKHFEHIYDSTLIEYYNGDLYFATSDTTRCAVYKLNNCNNISDKFKEGFRVLIPCEFLDMYFKLCDKNSNISFSYDKVKNKVFMSQEAQGDIGWTFECRVTLPDTQLFSKFPPIKCLLDKQYVPLCMVDKGVLVNRLATVSLVNKTMAIFKFADNKMTLKAISEVGLSPSVSEASVTNLNGSSKAVLSILHLSEVSKVIKDNEVTFCSSDNNRSYKIISAIDPNFHYYVMTNESTKYNLGDE